MSYSGGLARVWGRARSQPAVWAVAPAFLVLAFQLLFFPVPFGVWLQGVVLGLLNAMVVVGLVLVYRATRVINLAQASVGLFPANLAGAVVLFGTPAAGPIALLAALAALLAGLGARALTRGSGARSLATGVVVGAIAVGLLMAAPHLGWWGGLVVGLFVAVLSGMAIHSLIMSRFRRAPRLIVTVASIGLAQLFVVLGLLVPRLWSKVALITEGGQKTGFEVPGSWVVSVGSTVFGSPEIFAVVIGLVAIAVVGLALRFSDVGVAVRAAADRADRAVMLGLPVERLEAGVWVVACVLAFLSTYLQAGILGLEISAGIGLRVMVAALGAMVIGGMRSLPAMLTAAVAVGVLTQATGPAGGHSLTLTDAVLAAVVLAGVVLRRAASLRSERETLSSWQAAAEPRPIPPELASIRAVAWARRAVMGAALVIAVVVPLLFGDSVVLRLSGLSGLVVIAVSVVVLTGWAGEVTLGQMSFAALGASVCAYATLHWRFDFSLCLVLAAGAGALAASVLGVVSMRRSGIFVAVTTLAFALASINYLLNPTVATWIPTDDVVRRPLFGVFDLSSRRSMYYVALGVVVLVMFAVDRIRRARIGRILRAVRDNRSGAQAYGVRIPLARVTAFALSGALAGIGGALLFYVNERYEVALFSATEGLNAFVSTVVGGVSSVLGALVGVLVVDGSRALLSGPLALLPSAVGILAVLMLLPGGLAEVLYGLRRSWLRRFALSRGLHVSSLVADSREELVDASVASGVSAVRAEEVESNTSGLRLRSVEVAYDGVQVLFGVDLDIPMGQIVALLGTNGAGKSTVLRAVAGVAPLTGGTIHFDGVDLGALRPEQVAEQGIAQVPGGRGVFGSLTVEENLRAAAWMFRRDRELVARRTAEALAAFPVLADRLSSPAADLSGGQQQQLALAMALMAEPRMLLIDELSLGLAPAIVEGLLERLRAVRDAGTSVVVVEQSVNVALAVSDHAYFMEKGEVRYSGPAAALLEQPDLVRAVYLQGARDALAPDGDRARDALAPDGDRARDALAPDGDRARDALAPDGDRARDALAPVLSARGLSVSFGGVAAVSDVDLDVGAGEIVGLIGPNGAGKTTLLDLISGLTRATSGRLTLHGTDISTWHPSARARAGMGRSFQDALLFPGLSVAETIALALERWSQGDDVVSSTVGLPSQRDTERLVRARVAELIDMFGLGAFAAKLVGELSTGSRRMVDLACVVAMGPSVILLDEPTSGIAQREAEALGPVLLGLRDRLNASLLVIEHDIALISSIADRLVALDLGSVVTSGPPGEVLDHPVVVASYLGEGSVATRRSSIDAVDSSSGDGRS